MLYPVLFALLFGLVSVSGAFLFNLPFLARNLKYFLALSAGALLADAIMHILPEATENGFEPQFGATFLLAILVSFLMESWLRWRECCKPDQEQKVKRLAVMNLFGDAWCNFVDGIALSVAFLASPAVGMATGLAIFLHELPQEIADFATLLHSGFSKKQAIIANLSISLVCLVGVVVGWFVVSSFPELESYLLVFSAGSITYLALSSLIPEVHNSHRHGFNYISLLLFIVGMVLISSLLLLE